MRYSKLFTAAGSAILLGAASLAPAQAPMGRANSDDATFGKAGSVPYVSGGVGTDSTDRLNAVVGDFNLKHVFALKSGEYVSGVKVAIADAAGKTMLDATSDGPWFMAKLPAGNYRVVATLGGNAVNRQVAVGSAKLTTVDFRWASE